MSLQFRNCPECRSQLTAPLPTRNGKPCCPECGAILPSERADDGKSRLRAAPEASRRVAKSDNGSTRRRGADHERAVANKSGSLPIVLILLGVGFSLLVLLVLGGGLVAFLYFGEETPPVANVAPAAPTNPLPAAPANPLPAAPANPLPIAQVDPKPAPAKEPIQPVAREPQKDVRKDALPLKDLKAATVYIKTKTATTSASGSGFVVHSQGDMVYVVTNHHVISPHEQNDEPREAPPPPLFGPRMPGQPFGPRLPRMPRGPRFPGQGITQTVPSSPQIGEITVVFRSGTTQEQSLAATVVADSAGDDLAVLRATGAMDAPNPIDCRKTPELMETMPVVAFGFPFGEQLDRKKNNPAVTVTKGVISSLRGSRGEVEQVQLDLDLNPGNSGGPVVDEQGALIGVAVAKVANTRIGFAVPVPKLTQLLQGRIDPPTHLQTVTIASATKLRVLVPVADPLGKLRSPTLLYGLASEVRMPRKGANGWDSLSGAKSSPLTIQGTEASATLALTAPASGEVKILAQASYQTSSGQTIYGEPRTLSLGASNAPVVVAPPPAQAPKKEEVKRPQSDWTFAPRNEMFAITMPGGVKSGERKKILTFGPQRVSVEGAQSVLKDDTSFFAASLVIPVVVIREVPAGQRFNIFSDALLKHLKGEIVEEKDIKRDPVPGKEYQIKLPEGAARMQLYTVGAFVFYGMVEGKTKEAVNDKKADEFFDSLKLTDKAKDLFRRAKR